MISQYVEFNWEKEKPLKSIACMGKKWPRFLLKLFISGYEKVIMPHHWRPLAHGQNLFSNVKKHTWSLRTRKIKLHNDEKWGDILQPPHATNWNGLNPLHVYVASDTQMLLFSDWPNWCCALWCYVTTCFSWTICHFRWSDKLVVDTLIDYGWQTFAHVS